MVDTERYLLTVYRYIELNPVRAGMVDHASEYPWSSFQYNGAGWEVSLITPHDEYLRLEKNHEKRQKAYLKLFQGHMPDLDQGVRVLDFSKTLKTYGRLHARSCLHPASL